MTKVIAPGKKKHLRGEKEEKIWMEKTDGFFLLLFPDWPERKSYQAGAGSPAQSHSDTFLPALWQHFR